MEFTLQSEPTQESTNIKSITMDIDECFDAILKSCFGHRSVGESSIHGISCESVPIDENTYSNVGDSWTNVDDDEEWIDIGEALVVYKSNAQEPPLPNLRESTTSKESGSPLIENADHDHKIFHTECQDTHNNECIKSGAFKTTDINMNGNCHIPLIIKNAEDYVVFCNENDKENSQPVRDENLSSLWNNTNQVEYHRKHLDSNSVADHRNHLFSCHINVHTKMQNANKERNCGHEKSKHVSKIDVQSEKDCRSPLTCNNENVQENQRDASMLSIYENGVKIKNNPQTQIDPVIGNEGYMTSNAASAVWSTRPAIDVQQNNVNRLIQSSTCHHSEKDDMLADMKFQDALQTCTVFQTRHGNVSKKNGDKCAKNIGGEVDDDFDVTGAQTLIKTRTCQEQNDYDSDSQTESMNNEFINKNQTHADLVQNNGSMNGFINNNQMNILVNNNTHIELMSGKKLTHFAPQHAHNQPENVRNGYSFRKRKPVMYSIPDNSDSEDSDEKADTEETDDSYNFNSDDRSWKSSTDTDDDYMTISKGCRDCKCDFKHVCILCDSCKWFYPRGRMLNDHKCRHTSGPQNDCSASVLNISELPALRNRGSPENSINKDCNPFLSDANVKKQKPVHRKERCSSKWSYCMKPVWKCKKIGNLKIHLKHCKKLSFYCKLCYKGFNYEIELDNHTCFHLKPRANKKDTHKCHICEIKFTRCDSLRSHLGSVHEKLPYNRKRKTRKRRQLHTCEICNRAFKNDIELDNHTSFHLKSSANKKEDTITCHICEIKFTRSDSLRRHLESVHKKLAYNRKRETGKRRQLYTCEICYKGFKYKIELDNHTSFHLKSSPSKNEDKNECHICEIAFARSDNLSRHLRSVHEKLPYKNEDKNQCHICEKAFARSDNLSRHLRHVHEKRKYNRTWKKRNRRQLHTCEICYRGFKYEIELDNHTSFHLKSSPNKKEDPNKCNICEISFSRSDNLRRHLRHVHEQLPLNRKLEKRKRRQ